MSPGSSCLSSAGESNRGNSRSNESLHCPSPRASPLSVKHVTEEIPVYGNISYLQTGQSSGFESSVVPESQEEQESSPKKPTCYANLKMLKPQGRHLPESSVGGAEIQYTDVVVMGPRRSEPEIWGGGPLKGREATRPQSELYASVHADRYTAKFENQDYANNHAVPS
ncbi:signaling threshold-regulating transmembrane adapter 1 isoform 1-T1 [Pangshura tecta]